MDVHFQFSYFAWNLKNKLALINIEPVVFEESIFLACSLFLSVHLNTFISISIVCIIIDVSTNFGSSLNGNANS